MYRCAKCNEPIRSINDPGLQCEKCGSKIFFKERPSAKKVLKSDRAMFRAVVRIDGPAAAEAMGPESGRELPRTRTSVASEGGATVVRIEAEDASAMRAALNSQLECVRVVQDVELVAR